MKISSSILVILLLISCVNSKNPIWEKSKIELELVDEVYIKKELYGTDSIRLNKKQVELFIEEWNTAKSEGLHKIGAEFWVILKLKNDSTRKFRANKNLIKEKNDWTYSLTDSTLISSFWQPDNIFPRPENYDPISFINSISSNPKTDKATSRIGMTMLGEFPEDWVKEEHIDYLVELLDSREVCGCYLNVLSSYIPTDDFAEIGGFAGIFINAYKEKRKVELGLTCCPKVDEKLNAELIKWWKERK